MGPLTNGVEGHQEERVAALQTDNDIATLQRQSPGAVGQIYRAIESGQQISQAELDEGDQELCMLVRLWPTLFLDEQGILRTTVTKPGRNVHPAICPPLMRTEVIWRCHQMAHSGASRTTERLRLSWYWYGMVSMVRRTLSTCEVCQAAKHGKAPSTTGTRHLYSGRPWQWVAIDLVGPMPLTPRGNRWILVLSDHFTRWAEALPIPDATTPSVASALHTEIFSRFGIPEQLHSDQGTQFESELMTELCSIWGLNKTHTTPYRPQGNGVVERNNRTIGDSLRALLIGGQQTDWDLLLPEIMAVFRATPHTATKETPNYMFMGRENRLPDLLAYGQMDSNTRSRSQYAIELGERMIAVHEELRLNQKAVRTRDTDEPPLYAVGDHVWMVNHQRRRGEMGKLKEKYVGPYTIKEVRPNHTYIIAQGERMSVQNEARLKPYVECPSLGGRAPVSSEPYPQRPRRRAGQRPRQVEEEIHVEPQSVEETGEVIIYEVPSDEEDTVTTEIKQEPQEWTTEESTSEWKESTNTGRIRRRPTYLQEYDCSAIDTRNHQYANNAEVMLSNDQSGSDSQVKVNVRGPGIYYRNHHPDHCMLMHGTNYVLFAEMENEEQRDSSDGEFEEVPEDPVLNLLSQFETRENQDTGEPEETIKADSEPLTPPFPQDDEETDEGTSEEVWKRGQPRSEIRKRRLSSSSEEGGEMDVAPSAPKTDVMPVVPATSVEVVVKPTCRDVRFLPAGEQERI